MCNLLNPYLLTVLLSIPFNKLPVEVAEAATAAVEVVAVVWLAARTVLEEAGKLGVLWIVA